VNHKKKEMALMSIRDYVEANLDEQIPCFFACAPALPSAGWVAGASLVKYNTADGLFFYTTGDGAFEQVFQERGGFIPNGSNLKDREYVVTFIADVLEKIINKDASVVERDFAGGKAFELAARCLSVWDEYVQLARAKTASP